MLKWYKPCGADGLSPEGQSIDALLIAAGYARQECGNEHNGGAGHDLAICDAVYTRRQWDKVFLITHEHEAPVPGGAA
jgi:hypothetical protein